MSIVLGPNRYGKAEVRLVRLVRHTATEHDIADLNVSISLSGDLTETHLTGDNANVIPTDTMRGTVYAFAKERPFTSIEAFGLDLARHFVDTVGPVDCARVKIEEFPWSRIETTGGPHPHAWSRAAGTRYAGIVHTPDGGQVVSGVDDITVLKSTGSEFHGFLTDGYTTLQPAEDRILATSVSARWRHRGVGSDWEQSYTAAKAALLGAFADTHSLALQQTLYTMGRTVLEAREELVEVRLALPNKHHFPSDLSPYGLKNNGEVFYAADRPYGLIEGTVLREEAPGALPELPW